MSSYGSAYRGRKESGLAGAFADAFATGMGSGVKAISDYRARENAIEDAFIKSGGESKEEKDRKVNLATANEASKAPPVDVSLPPLTLPEPEMDGRAWKPGYSLGAQEPEAQTPTTEDPELASAYGVPMGAPVTATNYDDDYLPSMERSPYSLGVLEEDKPSGLQLAFSAEQRGYNEGRMSPDRVTNVTKDGERQTAGQLRGLAGAFSRPFSKREQIAQNIRAQQDFENDLKSGEVVRRAEAEKQAELAKLDAQIIGSGVFATQADVASVAQRLNVDPTTLAGKQAIAMWAAAEKRRMDDAKSEANARRQAEVLAMTMGGKSEDALYAWNQSMYQQDSKQMQERLPLVRTAMLVAVGKNNGAANNSKVETIGKLIDTGAVEQSTKDTLVGRIGVFNLDEWQKALSNAEGGKLPQAQSDAMDAFIRQAFIDLNKAQAKVNASYASVLRPGSKLYSVDEIPSSGGGGGGKAKYTVKNLGSGVVSVKEMTAAEAEALRKSGKFEVKVQ